MTRQLKQHAVLEFNGTGLAAQTWHGVLCANTVIPKWDRVVIGENLEICLPLSLKYRLRAVASFVRQQSRWRENHRSVPAGWNELTKLRASGHYLYAPRWTFPIFFFRDTHGCPFSGLLGLDIGARVSRADDINKVGPLKLAGDNPMLRETFRAHWMHYEGLGASMRAVDLVADPAEPRVEIGDVRLLKFPPCSFDFVTVPMIFGPGNPCSTLLEVVAGLSEVHRVLRPAGFAYVADGILHPSVCFAAQLIGFSVFISKGTTNGMPVGTILTKDPHCRTLAKFPDRDVLSLLTLSTAGDKIVSHCNLINDCQGPVVRSGYFDPT